MFLCLLAPAAGQQTERPAYTLDPLVVTGETATRSEAPLWEVPQAASVVTGEFVQDQGLIDFKEVFRYAPGAQGEVFGAETRSLFLRVRGFDAFEDGLFRDGMKLSNPGFIIGYSPEPYGAEQVDVFRGPASALFGQASPGGLVNYVTKKPDFEAPRGEARVGAGNEDYWSARFDSAGPIGGGEQFAYRLTGLLRETDTQVDFINNDRKYIAPALAWRPSEGTKLTLLSHYQEDDTMPSQRLPIEGMLELNPNGTIPVERFLGEPDIDMYEREEYALSYIFEHAWNSQWKFEQRGRYYKVNVEDRTIFPNALLDDKRTVTRSLFESFGELEGITFDNQVHWETRTWDLNHHLIAGLNLRFLDGDTRQTFGGAPNLDVFDPDYGADVAEAPVFKEEASDVTQVGVYLQDEIAFGKWTLLGNLRFDQSNNDLENRLASSETEQDDSEVTGRIAVSYNLENGLMPYATYMTSFLPITGTDVNGRLFQPETAEQIEAGVKYRTDYALFSLGGFNLKREAFVTFDPNRAFGGVQQGEARSRGVEAELRAAPLRGWNVIASYTYLDTKLTDSAAPEEVGEPNPYTPENGASLWTDYTIQTGPLRNLQLGLGARFVGSNYADIFGGRNDSLEVPSELLFDAAIQYRAGAWTLSLTANNLFDEEHVASAFGSFGSNFATYGPTRAARLWLGYAY